MNSSLSGMTKPVLRNVAEWLVKLMISCGLSWVLRLFLDIGKKGFKLYVSRASTMADYVAKTSDFNSLEYMNGRTRSLIYCLPRYGNDRTQMQTVENCDGKYIAKINNATIIGGSNLVITHDGYGLNDMFANDTTRHIRYNGRAFKMTIGNREIVSIVPPAKMPIIEKGVMLSVNFSLNYFHFTMEVLPRFQYLERCVPPDVPLIVDSDMVKYDQFREILQGFNAGRREVIVVPAHETVEVKEFFYPSIAPYIAPDVKETRYSSATDSLFDTDALDFIRQKMVIPKAEKIFPRRIFLYRPGGVRNFNQDEVFTAIEPFGFVKVQTEKMSVAEQVALFNGAEIIVGGSGAALTNILYCNKNCKIYVVVKSAFKDITVFSTIAMYVGADLRYISADLPISNNPDDFHANFIIDPQIIINLLDI